MTTETEKKTVTVYVRLGDEDGNTRTLSFKRLEEISDEEALEKGCAIDGNELVLSMAADGVDDSGFNVEYGTPALVSAVGGTLNQNLALTEKALMEWLKSKGYTVKFS